MTLLKDLFACESCDGGVDARGVVVCAEWREDGTVETTRRPLAEVLP